MRTTRPNPIHALALIATTALVAGCSDDPPAAPSVILEPPPEGQGVQYTMRGHIEAGSEVEQCVFVQAPADGLWVQRQDIVYDPGSHHFLLYETSYDEIPTAKDDGTPVDTSGVFDCSDGPTNSWSVTRLIGGSQSADGAPPTNFPSDVALRVRPNAVLMMNAHYLNVTTEPLEPDVAINLWTLPEEEVSEEGDVLFWYNIFIEAPAMQSSEARMRCVIPEDITLTNTQSHMHRRGVGFEALVVGDDAPFYVNTRWEDVPVSVFDGGMDIAGGTEIEYACTYDNREGRDVYQGPRSTDEMCMLIGSYYPARPGLSFCAADPARPNATNSLGAQWVGQGETSCVDTLGCVQAAGDAEDFFTELQRCVAASDPAHSREVSDGVRCLLMSFADGQDALEVCTQEINACIDA